MARVIKEGPAFAWKFTCRECHSQIEAELSDVREGEFGGNYAEAGIRRFFVRCPVCGAAGNFVPDQLMTPNRKNIVRGLTNT